MSTTNTDRPLRTVAGIPSSHAAEAIDTLHDRLTELIDLRLTLKHIHWNVVGVDFIAVHEMLDGFVTDVDLLLDNTAERIRILGGEPNGLAGHIAEQRTWSDYPIGEAPTAHHLRTLDEVFELVALGHRRAQAQLATTDPVSEDLVIESLRTLEKQQWFVRSFLRGPQIDLTEKRFGWTTDDLTDEESAIADRNPAPTESNKQAYREMTELGANVPGEGSISG